MCSSLLRWYGVDVLFSRKSVINDWFRKAMCSGDMVTSWFEFWGSPSLGFGGCVFNWILSRRMCTFSLIPLRVSECSQFAEEFSAERSCCVVVLSQVSLDGECMFLEDVLVIDVF